LRIFLRSISDKVRRSIIAGPRISDSGINQVEFFFNIFWVDGITCGLILTLFGMSIKKQGRQIPPNLPLEKGGTGFSFVKGEFERILSSLLILTMLN